MTGVSGTVRSLDRLRTAVSSGRALSTLAVRQLAHDRVRTLVAVCAVAVAVLSMTLLAGAGLGVLETGTEQFERADRDLWITGGSLGLTAANGGFENSIHDSHDVAADVSEHDQVSSASPLSFETVYVSDDGSSFDTIIAVGVTGSGESVTITEGSGFSGEYQYYTDEAYDGPMNNEVIIDERTAATYDLSVGDTIRIGGTLSAARENEFTVVGISPTFSEFLGAQTVTLRLGDLQTITGTTGTDRATMITVSLEDDADPHAVQSDLQEEYPAYEVRTNREQFEDVLAQQAIVIAGATLVVGLALLAGAALTVALLALFVYQNREKLGALWAVGVSRRTISEFIVAQGVTIGALGWLLGVVLTVPAAFALDALLEYAVGYEELVVVSPIVLGASGLVAIGIGTIASFVAAHNVSVSVP